MSFNRIDLSTIQEKLHTLPSDRTANWGQMTAQRMVEHLTDALRLSFLPHSYPLTVPEDKIPRALAFLESDHPMPKNFQVQFATPDSPLRCSNLSAAIEELIENWREQQKWWEENPSATRLHPSFGLLGKEQWALVHDKHFAHHFEQFGL